MRPPFERVWVMGPTGNDHDAPIFGYGRKQGFDQELVGNMIDREGHLDSIR
ncbi:MAG: hypothetical protein AAGA54_24180 [Myxococcota bacterium]